MKKEQVNYIDLPLAEWQKKNCKNCYFADIKKVGTAKPCCTYTGSVVVDCLGHCKSRKEKWSTTYHLTA